MLMAQFRIASLWWWIVDGLQTKRFEGVKTGTTQGFSGWEGEKKRRSVEEEE